MSFRIVLNSGSRVSVATKARAPGTKTFRSVLSCGRVNSFLAFSRGQNSLKPSNSVGRALYSSYSRSPCLVSRSSADVLGNGFGNQVRMYSDKKDVESTSEQEFLGDLTPLKPPADANVADFESLQSSSNTLFQTRRKDPSRYYLGEKPMSWKDQLKLNPEETPSSIRRPKNHKILFREVKLKKYSIPGSPSKLNLVARLVRTMNAGEAMDQLRYAKQRKAADVMKLLHRCLRKAKEKYNLDREDLVVAVAEVGKGKYEKRLNYHARGRVGLRHLKSCHLTIVLRETPEAAFNPKNPNPMVAELGLSSPEEMDGKV
mmetsp:Transcript_14108/g.17130  ORF Transcript_14108/g.17130 Transcript_14108/m.17130 type:complete len:316 (-) Transcript_14108:2285-3232(-)